MVHKNSSNKKFEFENKFLQKLVSRLSFAEVFCKILHFSAKFFFNKKTGLKGKTNHFKVVYLNIILSITRFCAKKVICINSNKLLYFKD